MCRPALDIYDVRPKNMSKYLGYYGWHFNRLSCDFATSLMKKTDENGEEKEYKPKSKQEVAELFAKHGIKEKVDYDTAYLFNMYCSDLPLDEKTICIITRYARIDVDAADGNIMRKWYASMVGNGEPIYWEDFLDDKE